MRVLISIVPSYTTQRQENPEIAVDDNVVRAESLMQGYPYGERRFSIPAMEDINKAAYWDYQRDQVYVKSSKRLHAMAQRQSKSRMQAFTVDEIIVYPHPIRRYLRNRRLASSM